jgi:glycosyltransferase involved in cell wall biosynthesis
MTSHQQSSILFISTFPPRKCGIASFTQDLINAINPEIKNETIITVCALDKKNAARLYDQPVTMVMDSFEIDSCLETAVRINQDESIKLICIEHEFGLFGGELGEYLLGFLSMLEKPFIIRFHTVLPEPSPKRLKMVQSISSLADKVIVMTNHSASLLENDYHIPVKKILRIPHGTHNHSTIDPLTLKHQYDLDNRLVLTNFGLLSPNKGVEKAILAMKTISKKFPQAIYLILGQTHPNLIVQEGEKYRDYLQQLIAENGLQKNVRLINGYMTTEKLMEYLTLTDIYLFTSKDPNQAVSGTFLYAMSAGCPIISNSFVLAKEMLDEQTGIILKTNDEKELAEQAIHLLQNDVLRKQMGHNAYLKTRNTTWEKVAGKHTRLFGEVTKTPITRTELSNNLSPDYYN